MHFSYYSSGVPVIKYTQKLARKWLIVDEGVHIPPLLIGNLTTCIKIVLRYYMEIGAVMDT